MSFLFSWCSTGGVGPTAVWWLSLLHLISIFSGPQTLSRYPRAPSAGCGFSYHTSSPTVWNSPGNCLPHRTQLNYIIVWRPLDLWNRMFNRHQAEITVMQFRGHSLPVHHSVVYHGNSFCSSHFISQFPPTRFPLITAIRICLFLPVHHLGMAFLAGSKGQNITISDGFILDFERGTSPEVSRTLLSILADLNNAVVWIVSFRPPVSLPILRWLYQACQLHLLPPSLSCSIVIHFLSKVYILFAFHQFYPGISRNDDSTGTLFCWLSLARGVVVIAVGNEHGDTSSNPGRYWLHFT